MKWLKYIIVTVILIDLLIRFTAPEKLTPPKEDVTLEAPKKVLQFNGLKLSESTYPNTSKVEYQNWQLTLPWGDMGQQEVSDKHKVIHFKTGLKVVILDESYNTSLIDFDQKVKKLELYPEVSAIDPVSNFQAHYSALSTENDAIEEQTEEHKRKALKLKVSMKNELLNGLVGIKIFHFEKLSLKGFQFGDPSQNQKVRLNIFRNDANYITLTFNAPISQKEIDFIINQLSYNPQP